jgi:hypothetical protein
LTWHPNGALMERRSFLNPLDPEIRMFGFCSYDNVLTANEL